PKLNVYRQDLITPDLDVSTYPKLNIEGILVSHPHMDHFGNIGLLDTELPIISSPQAIALMKGMADSSRFTLNLEVAFYSKKTKGLSDNAIRAIKGAYKTRNIICTDKMNSNLEHFLSTDIKHAPDRITGMIKPLDCGDLCDLDTNPTQFDIDCFEVDHSIYGANAYILSGETSIAYTGDFRLHGKKAEKSRKFIQAARDSSVLIIEGTRVSREDVDESEEEVHKNCLKTIQEAPGLVVADFSARNFERLDLFRTIAKKCNREIVVPAKQVFLLRALEQVDGINKTREILVYGEYKTSKNYWEENFLKNQVNYIEPVKIAHVPENYILCFSLYEIKHLLDINPQNGTYIYSSSEAFEEESEFDFIRLNNWLKHFGFRVYGFEIINEGGKIKPVFSRGFHASGHASKSDISWAINTIDPDYIIPVHTENPNWFKESFDNVILLNEGQKFEL
ncbi:MAG: MBL fold metallo-hydrolase RNA specificity domain-containing protein, partial [Candidatus Hodarchaeota archaeon]